MDDRWLELLITYNPWWAGGTAKHPQTLPFHRPLFHTLREDLDRIPQILSITGPRRIGKTTLLHQLIALLLERGIKPTDITYYSFDDPALNRKGLNGGELLDNLMRSCAQTKTSSTAYLFLDEIQRLDRWELHLKKYYDLKFPARVIISGSASSPIFKKSRESLLGRVKDYHLLPFSFREFLLYQWRDQPGLVGDVERLYVLGKTAQGLLTGDPHTDAARVTLVPPEASLRTPIQDALSRYFLEGGFPEVWNLPDWVSKQDYLFDNQVKKVLYEDLVLAAEFRKPDMLKRFYISLLERPGREVSIQSVAGETGTSARQIEKYLPLLEMTDLVYHLSKFRKSPLRVRKGRMKFYLVDLALRNAVLRLTDTLLQDEATLGLYAENLVFLALKKWRGAIQMDYYRDRDGEVDFVVHVGPRAYLPVEVKYRNAIQAGDVKSLKGFAGRYSARARPILVTKRWEDFGWKDDVLFIPLPMFLLMFD